MANFHFFDAANMFERKAKRNNYKRLTHDVYLYKGGSDESPYFTVRLFGTDIVRIYPEYQVLNPGGWHTMRTAKEMVAWSAAWEVFLKDGGLRIYHSMLKRGSCNIISGMKIANNGMPFEESITSDWMQKTKPEVVRAWKQLTMPLTRALTPRFALGEFDDQADTDRISRVHPFDLATLADMDRTFPEHDVVVSLLEKVPEELRPTRRSWMMPRGELRTPAERWRALLNQLRTLYYEQNDGYMQVEVPNV